VLVAAAPDDDMIRELAFAERSKYMVTPNIQGFRGCEQLRIEAKTPGEFLSTLKEGAKP
jgi:hypothetical protein